MLHLFNRYLALALIVATVGLSRRSIAAPPQAAVPLIPWPKALKMGDGRSTVSATSRIAYADATLQPLAKVLSDELFMLSGKRLEVVQADPQAGDVSIKIDAALKPLAQHVEVDPKTISAVGGSYDAAAMATATLLQATTVKDGTLSLPNFTVDDEPGSIYCGTMVDVARQWQPAESLKPVIEMCRLYKIHYLHLHMTDNQLFTFPSTAFPKLASEQHYTLDELKDLVAYGDARGVVLVPEIEMPGHTQLDQKMPELFGAIDPATGKAAPLGVMNITNEAIYPAVDTLVGEVCDVFKSSPYFHMGSDETNFSEFNKNPAVVEYKKKVGKDTQELFADFINRVNAIIKKHGKETIVWEGFGPDSRVDTDVIVMAWHGSSHSPQDLLSAGYHIINVPWIPSVYNSVRENFEWNIWRLNLSEQGNSTQFDPTPNVIGGEMVLWEKGPADSLPMLRTKAPARIDRVYSPNADRPYEDFAARLASTDAILDHLLFPVHIEATELLNRDELNIGKSAKVAISSSMAGTTIRYAINSPELAADSPVYTMPLTITADQAIQVYLSTYYGRQITITAAAFDADGKQIGAPAMLALRNDVPRLTYKLYHPEGGGKFEMMPQFSKLKPFESGVIGRPESASDIHRGGGSLAVVMNGKFESEGDGEYRFEIDGANVELQIDGRVVCALKPDQASVVGTVHLSKGTHTIAISAFTMDGDLKVKVPIDAFPIRTKHHWEDRGLYEWLVPLKTP